MKKYSERRILILGYFWTYGILALICILPIISYLIFFNVDVLRPYTPYAFFISMGLPMCALGIDIILGCIFEFDHMILLEQAARRERMTPYDLEWNVSKKNYIICGIIFCSLGLAAIILPFFVKLF